MNVRILILLFSTMFVVDTQPRFNLFFMVSLVCNYTHFWPTLNYFLALSTVIFIEQK